MKKTLSLIARGSVIAASALVAMPALSAAEVEGWGDFKLYIDPGHAGTENGGLWGYSEAEKTVRVALGIKDMLLKYTDIPEDCIKLCREDDSKQISLQERTDEANAWGADFYYSIHSDASASKNTIVCLFGGWTVEGVNVEKSPNGGKAYGEFLNPNLAGVMRVESRGNRYDRDYYMATDGTHTNQYPYLHVNRETNMPSLLSEGGYHTIAEQQQRNLNDDYKRLESFAAFQAILQYRGLSLPAQNFVTGMVYNSENQQPLNGAKITVSAEGVEPVSYITDSYDSLFYKYTKNPNLIHNGFFMFENLPAGEYTITYEAEGFETVTNKITTAAGGATSADYITFADQALTNIMPAVVSTISVDNLEAVESYDPLTITFSRNMDRASVEQAFSIDNDAQVALSWDNDYTLKVDISSLEPLWEYVITIDGSVAKNSQTGAFLDGDADGVAGGDYVLTFTMAEPDTDAPYVVSTYPAEEGEAVYCQRPPIRVQFNEIIQWNSDANEGWFEVKDSDGKVYTVGHVTHANINNASVLHCYLSEDLAADKAILVTLKPVVDRVGNVSDEYAFRFLSEYRECTTTELIRQLDTLGSFWEPGGSGSSDGFVENENFNSIISDAPFIGLNGSFGVNYSFDQQAATPSWRLRVYDKTGNDTTLRGAEGILSMWVYGDASNNFANVLIRDQSSNGLFKRSEDMLVDFLGWNFFYVDLSDATAYAETLTNNQPAKPLNRYWYLDALWLEHFSTDDEFEPTDPSYAKWTGLIGYSTLQRTKWAEGERKATIDDVQLPNSSISNVAVDANAPVEFFNLQGIRVDNPANGVYIRRQGNTSAKVLVK